MFENLYERFGVYNVMDAYDYTSEPSILSDSRVRKSMYATLMWTEKDFVTHLFGFAYSDMIYNGSNYDLENDFPAVFYFCGYIGFTLYMLFLALFVGMIFQAFFQDVSAAWKDLEEKGRRLPVRSLCSFGGGVKRFLTMEMGAVGMTFLPVSYTHLDVYKRQALFRYWRFGRCSGLSAPGAALPADWLPGGGVPV